MQYIHELKEWPYFRWNNDRLILTLGKVRNIQGKLQGKMESLGFELLNNTTLENLTQEVIKTSEIEGEQLNLDQVRSSIARRLGMDIAGLVPSDRNVDGVVDMMLDAVKNYDDLLTKERLCDWHASLFPTGRSGMYKILVGDWRDDSTGPMQVVSGAMGKERVHFQAPAAEKLDKEMLHLMDFINYEDLLDPIIMAGIAHLWILTIHPFEDGNGRIARAVTDMLLTKADGVPQRFYSMSAQIRIERKGYYKILEQSQKGTLEITAWLDWFLKCLLNAMVASEQVLTKVLHKYKFWNSITKITLNERQVLMLNKLLDGFKGKLTSSKWAKIAKCSRDTALRDIQDLIKKRILQKEASGGRSTNYELNAIQ